MFSAPRSAKHRLSAILVCLAASATLLNVVQGADLRMSIGDKTVVRTTEIQPIPQPMPQPDSTPLPGQNIAPPGTQFGDMAYSMGPDGGYFDDFGCCGPCRNWADADFLLWFRRGRSLPPLVAVGPVNATQVVYGNETVGTGVNAGGRFEVGRWVDDTQTLGYGLRGFMLGDNDTNFDIARAAGTGALGIPFLNATTNAPDVFLVADPNGGPAYGGTINVKTTSRVYGSDFFLRFLICDTGATRVDFLLGYQYTRIDESLVMTSQLTEPGVTVRDSFRTQNEFSGGTIGLKYQWFGPRVRVDFLGKIAFGNMHESVIVNKDGSTNGGLFARSTNVGLSTQNMFCVLPELGTNLVVPLGPRWDFNVGYSMLFWSTALQPGAQIDRGVNLGALPPNRPTTRFNDTDYWVHGVNLGLTFRF